jgi:hypothetical protein
MNLLDVALTTDGARIGDYTVAIPAMPAPNWATMVRTRATLLSRRALSE